MSTTLDITNTSGMVNSVYTIYKYVDLKTNGIFTDHEIKRVAVLINQDVLRDVVTRLYQNSSMLYGGPLHTFIDNAQSGVLSMNDSSVADVADSTTEFTTALVNDNIDEYLSDRKLF